MISHIINLPHRLDRKESVMKEVAKLPVNDYYLVKAVQHTTPWIGCFLSHKQCILSAKTQQLDCILLLEDDVMFTDNVIQVFDAALEDLSNLQWDMLYLGANVVKPSTRITNNLVRLMGAHTTHAYAVKSTMYDTILDLPTDKPIDVYYEEMMCRRNVYMCNPMIAYQKPSHSDVEGGYRDYVDLLTTRYNQNIR